MKWNEMSNTEIRIKMSSMKEEYEVTKNKINNLLSILEQLDNNYLTAQRVLEERKKQ